MKTKKLFPIILAAAAAALLIVGGVAFWKHLPPRARGHLHFLTPRLTGKVTLCDGEDERVYHFSSPGGYGSYEWTVGPKDDPVKIIRYNANNWYVTDMDLRVERKDNEWIVSGTVNTDGEPLESVSDTIPFGEPIVIDCGGL